MVNHPGSHVPPGEQDMHACTHWIPPVQMKAKLLTQLHVSSESCLSGLKAGIAAVQARAARPGDSSGFMVTLLPDARPSTCNIHVA